MMPPHLNVDPATLPMIALHNPRRAARLLKELADSCPQPPGTFRQALLGPLASSDVWQLRLEAVRTVATVRWQRSDVPRVYAILRANMYHQRPAVRAAAIEGLANLAAGDPGLLAVVRRSLRDTEVSIREVRRRLDRRRR